MTKKHPPQLYYQLLIENVSNDTTLYYVQYRVKEHYKTLLSLCPGKLVS